MQTALTYRTNRNLFSNQYLDERLPETEAWAEVSDGALEAVYDAIEALWKREKRTAPRRSESRLEETFIRPVFRKLGISFEAEERGNRTERRPDYAFFESDDAARNAFARRDAGGDFYEGSVAVADAKRWGRPLDTRGSGNRERDFENPSYRIHVTLQETPARWGVLTNGRKWRLYSASASHRLDAYYEIDLPAVLENGDLEDFKYFYLFFRHEAFLERAGGDSFLDDVYDESTALAREIEADLRDNVYEAITVLATGYLEHPDNDLDETDLDLLYDSSLVFLYRLLFVLYAESDGRDLLDTSNERYERSYSLRSLKREVAAELDGPSQAYRDRRDGLQSRLDELFRLIDRGSESHGIPEEILYVPAYNGELFCTDPDEDDSREATFLATHAVGDGSLARVIELLTRRENAAGDGPVFVDYSSLDVRHLGSLYEGALEHRLEVAREPLTLDDGAYVTLDEDEVDDVDVAVEPGEVYLTTGSGERKATGSYYTPEYIVEYIVENTLGPLVENIRLDLEGARDDSAAAFARRVFDLRVLDPAMGSGRFLTSAVDYLAREIIDAEERQAAQQGVETVDADHDINWARRQVAQRCLYGVDRNPLAVELAKVSLWFRTLAADRPFVFLDHHLKTGNSLVGSEIEAIEMRRSDGGGDGQLDSAADFEGVPKAAIERLLRSYRESIAVENRDLADATAIASVYDAFERDERRRRLEAMANVHTAEAFGLDSPPDDAYERMAAALRDDERWEPIEQRGWFRNAQQRADGDGYFHWELAYPDVFFDEEGSRRESPGFDAVLGNPPWVRSINLKAADTDRWGYYTDQYRSAANGAYDAYLCFIENGLSLLNDGGELGYVVPNKWFTSRAGENLRALLAQEQVLETIVDFGPYQLFDGVTTYSCLLFLNRSHNEEVDVWQLAESESTEKSPLPEDGGEWNYGAVDIEKLDAAPWTFDIGPIGRIFEGLSDYPTVADVANVFQGIGTRADPIFVLTERDDGRYSEEVDRLVDVETALLRPAVTGTDVDRYDVDDHRQLLFPYETDPEVRLLPRDVLENRYPNAWAYLRRISGRLEEREGGKYAGSEEWYQYGRPQNMRRAGEPKVVVPDVVNSATAAYDATGRHILDTVYGVQSDAHELRFLTGLLNSDLLSAFLKYAGTDLRGGYFRMKTAYLNPFPVPDVTPYGEIESISAPLAAELEAYAAGDLPEVSHEERDENAKYRLVCKAVDLRTTDTDRLSALNANLLDHLGQYRDGGPVGQLPEYRPSAGVSERILSETAADRESLRIGDVEIREDGKRLTILASARYKPETEDAFETDQWGYAETALEPAIEFVDLDTVTRTLVREFVPVAVANAGGFANFRKTATKTNSLVDRLTALTLPKIEDVEADLRRFSNARAEAERLDARIDRIDAVIDDVLFDLYGLTDDEIAAIERALDD